MTTHKKTLNAAAALEDAMPDCFAVRARASYETWRGTKVTQGDDEAQVCARLVANVGSRLTYAAHTADVSEKRRYIYDAIALLMVMLKKVETADND